MVAGPSLQLSRSDSTFIAHLIATAEYAATRSCGGPAADAQTAMGVSIPDPGRGPPDPANLTGLARRRVRWRRPLPGCNPGEGISVTAWLWVGERRFGVLRHGFGGRADAQARDRIAVRAPPWRFPEAPSGDLSTGRRLHSASRAQGDARQNPPRSAMQQEIGRGAEPRHSRNRHRPPNTISEQVSVSIWRGRRALDDSNSRQMPAPAAVAERQRPSRRISRSASDGVGEGTPGIRKTMML